jgi:hypothetical protein
MLDRSNHTAADAGGQVLAAHKTMLSVANSVAGQWYIDCVRRAKSGPFAELVRLTPEKAALLLEVNEDNRNASPNKIAEIAADIRAGNFELNGETVIISRDGLLNDGQHRLMAILETGIGIDTFVVFGIKRSARLTVDTGIIRTAGNFIAMAGGKETNQAASVSLWLMAFNDGIVTMGGLVGKHLTKARIVANYLEFKDEIDEAILFVSNKEAKEMRSRTALACAYIVLSRINHRAADDFIGKLCVGAGYEKTSAIHATRRRLIDTQSMRLRPGEKLTIILAGWNAWRRGETPRTIQLRSDYPKLVA